MNGCDAEHLVLVLLVLVVVVVVVSDEAFGVAIAIEAAEQEGKIAEAAAEVAADDVVGPLRSGWMGNESA